MEKGNWRNISIRGNKLKIRYSFCFLTLLIASYANAQALDSRILVSTPENTSGKYLLIGDELLANSNAMPIVKCRENCGGEYGVKLDPNSNSWVIFSILGEDIKAGSRFEVSAKSTFKLGIQSGVLKIQIPMNDAINNCSTNIGLSYSPAFYKDLNELESIENGLVPLRHEFDVATYVLTLEFGADRPIEGDKTFHVAIDRLNNECFNIGVNIDQFRAFNFELMVPYLQARIVEDLEISDNLVLYNIEFNGKRVPLNINAKNIQQKPIKISPPEKPLILPKTLPKTKISKPN